MALLVQKRLAYMYLANCLALAIESPLYYSYMCLNFYSATHEQLVSTHMHKRSLLVSDRFVTHVGEKYTCVSEKCTCV